MEKEIKQNTEKIVKHPYWIFTIGIIATINAINTIIKTIKMIIDNIPLSELPIFSLDFFQSLMQLVSVFILYFVYKAFIKLKGETEGMVNGVNDGFSLITDNLNDSHRKNDLKIRYVDFRNEYKNLDNKEYFKKLTYYGFSIEDLIEIGIDESFIQSNKDKLLPKKILEKYNDFRNELNEYKSHIKKQNEHH